MHPSQQNAYAICTRCVMDTSDPELELDASGVCNHCRRYDSRMRNEVRVGEERDAQLQRVIEEIKLSGQGKDYDCLIGVSGGVDSSYVALLCKQFGLRPLAVHFDNGWNSELAVGNIERLVKVLGIDLLTHVMDWEEFRDLQVSYLKSGVPNCEVPTDHAIGAVMYGTAAKHGIRHVITGGNLATEGIMPASWAYDSKDQRNLLAIHRRFGTRPLKHYPSFGMFKFAKFLFWNRLQFVRLLNAVPYDKSQAMRELQEKCGWVPYPAKHYESVYTRWYQAYYLVERFGYDKRRAHFSSLVCSGQMARDQALQELKKPLYDAELFQKDHEFVLKKLRLSAQEFEALMNSTNHRHQDYPSMEAWMQVAKRFEKWIRKVVLRL